jgi:hypothetical protein
MTARRAIAAAVLALLLAGCTARLRPAPTATLVPGRGQGAEATEAGVRVVARAGAWRARPPGLEGVVTPVLVTVENGSDRTLRIRYDDFSLVGADGRRFAALAPFEIEGTVSEPAPAYAFPRSALAPRLLGFHRGRPVYLYDPVWYDPFWYDPFYGPGFLRVDLPTGDMVQLALPEGTVEPRARVSGFVYFERVRRDAGRVDFTARLADARTGEPMGRVVIPFVVE